MKYYKIIQDNNFIGVVNSNNFIYYHPYDRVLMCANEINGQFIECKGKLYRDTWMVPTPNDAEISFERGIVIEISETEYDELQEAIEQDEIIEVEDPEPVIIPTIDPFDGVTLNFIKDSKIQEMSRSCRTIIEEGFDIELRGETHHFSLTTQDQLNLMSLSALAQTQSLIPYHADGEECTFYTSDEINTIMKTATELKIYQTTYFNALKEYINSLETVEEVSAITYGTSIPEEFKSDVLKVLE